MIGLILTLLRSSAASSFFWMSSRDRSLFGGLVTQWATSDTGEDGFRMTSKAWPEARLLMGLMSMSACVCINEKGRQKERQAEKPFVVSVWLFLQACLMKKIETEAFSLIKTYLQSHPWCFCGPRGTDKSRWVRELKSPSSSLCKLWSWIETWLRVTLAAACKLSAQLKNTHTCTWDKISLTY